MKFFTEFRCKKIKKKLDMYCEISKSHQKCIVGNRKGNGSLMNYEKQSKILGDWCFYCKILTRKLLFERNNTEEMMATSSLNNNGFVHQDW